MTGLFRPVFQKFEAEAKIIGTILTGYSELEIALLLCVVMGRNRDFDSVLKAMFRARGETLRVNIADGVGREAYRKLELEPQFSRMIGMMLHCVKIRNQYAHCNFWDDHSRKLAFANLEEVAKRDDYVTSFESLTAFHLDEEFLLFQEHFFYSTEELIDWVNKEGQVRAGIISGHIFEEPAPVELPPLRIR